MDPISAFKTLKSSKQFKDWNKKNPDAFFSYALIMIENGQEQPWQIGFYHESQDKIVTFVVNGDEIEMQQEEEIFKKPDTELKPIEIEKAKMSFSDILEKVKEFTDKNYPNELINKTIAILQALEKYSTVWNITLITHSFNTINIKASPEDGKILHNKIESIMGMIKK